MMTLLGKVALLGFVFFVGSFFESMLEEKTGDVERTISILFSLTFMLACAVAFCAGG